MHTPAVLVDHFFFRFFQQIEARNFVEHSIRTAGVEKQPTLFFLPNQKEDMEATTRQPAKCDGVYNIVRYRNTPIKMSN